MVDDTNYWNRNPLTFQIEPLHRIIVVRQGEVVMQPSGVLTRVNQIVVMVEDWVKSKWKT
jgi:hypothetical protein